ncbi:class I SAM-dependent methyltransferase [Cohnella luojiensis]|uniref:Class I SAM-dependent methyltransferase n=1 Tax=Cohnella luojiensis TaxID=652876 RepID=A0A4Y8LR26_9BACL|nr:class I SAM-dependent methyltransferase [Cohnella luojiensis]TFE23865.1 class I SAM-dependent methyltransferase [Cohnella luojiensis]
MNDHYYSSKPKSASNRRAFETMLRGIKLQLTSDAGVFSRDGVDYGSRVLIELMDIPQDAQVLDIGCGYGPIGLIAARLAPQGHVKLIDVNERAVELAKHNAQLNGILNVSVAQSDLFVSVEGETFDVILSNPPIRAGKTVVHRLFEESWRHLSPGGTLWVVIQNKQGASSARAKLEEIYGEEAVVEAGKDKGFRIYSCTKSQE